MIGQKVARVAVLAAVTVLAGAASARAQSTSASLSVSVMVVRPCTITQPASEGADQSAPATVSCGRGTVPFPETPGILPIAGAAAPAVVTTTPTERGRTVTINF